MQGAPHGEPHGEPQPTVVPQSDLRLPKPEASVVVKRPAAARRGIPKRRPFISKPPLTGLVRGMTATSLQRIGPNRVGKNTPGEAVYPNCQKSARREQGTGCLDGRQRKLH